MAEMRVFISSTCYDLSLLRSQLRLFIKNMGYEPIMSDYEDVLYDPRVHTHTSCVDEVGNCDVLILIIGSRFGGKAAPESLNKIKVKPIADGLRNLDITYFGNRYKSYNSTQTSVERPLKMPGCIHALPVIGQRPFSSPSFQGKIQKYFCDFKLAARPIWPGSFFLFK